MTFNDEIYQAACNIWPATSVRSLSKALGRSTGYWSSIKSQNLKISTNALMNLISTLEIQITIAKHVEMQRQMMQLKRKISAELVRRFIEQIEADEIVLKELEQLEYTNDNTGFSSSLPMPIFITSNDTYGRYR
jgi:hypothetical protein